MAHFFKRLSYSIGNEDWLTEQKALAISASDRVLTITASGDRPLNLLAVPCKEIVSVDANPFQTALCDLKKAAMARLDYEEYLAFLGLMPHSNRLAVLKKLESLLSGDTALCWKNYSHKIVKGVAYEGQVERLCKKASSVIKTFDGKKIDRLFSAGSLQEQREFVENHWSWKTWKVIVEIAMHPIFTRFFIKDPGLYKHVDTRPSTYLYQRIEMALKTLPIRENLILSLVFQGKIFQEGFSPHLSPAGKEEIAKRLNALTLKTTNIFSYLSSAPDNSIDCFSLSDIASYMAKKDFDRLCKEVVRVASPGARFCIRHLMSTHDFDESLRPHFLRNGRLEEELEREDRCFLYRFKVGKIQK